MKRSSQDLSFNHSTTFDMGELVPIGAIDVLPGDTFRHACNALARVSPLAKPVFHDCEIRIHNWFVPNRLLWDDWEEFIVGNEAAATYPTITPSTAAEAELYDYMGAEPVTSSAAYDALPIRAYNLIYNEFYRDQDLDAPRTIDLTDGADTTTTRTLARVAWGKDYYTTARPNPQQGTAVDVGFTGTIDVERKNNAAQTRAYEAGTNTLAGTNSDLQFNSSSLLRDTATSKALSIDPNGAWEVDLSTATGGLNINDLRDAISTQRIAEAREFFGSRYVDYLRWYGVNPSDGRLDRPEYLGGGRQRLSFSEVLATAETGSTVNVGDLYGHGIAGVRQRPIRKMFEEHGWFISLAFVRPKSVYQNGIPKRFLRREPQDFWHRELELLPWQEINELELFAGGSSANVFGYAPRYSEYRETLSYVSSTMRGGTEEDWTLAREFASAPTLNSSFVTCTPSDRIYLDNTQPEILCTFNHQLMAKRLVSAQARMSNRAGI